MNGYRIGRAIGTGQSVRFLVLALLLLTAGFPLNGSAQSLNEKLIRDVEDGNLAAVRQDLANGADVNAKDDHSYTALMKAATKGDTQVAQVLLDHGADVNAKNKYGSTALMGAAFSGRLDIAKALLDRGADVNARDQNGTTALMEAAWLGHLDVAKTLIERGADVDARTNRGSTALDEAKQSGKEEEFRELVDSAAALRMAWQRRLQRERRAEAARRAEAQPAFGHDVTAGDTAAQARRFHEALQHYVAALQRLPEETPVGVKQPLLEKIIKVVLQLNPPPAIPGEAMRHAAYAEAAVEETKQPSDYDNAVDEWEKVLRLAPWWDKAYFNLGLLLEKTNRPGEAAQALHLYLLANPHAQNVEDIQTRIYKLQYKAKKQ